MISKVLSSLKQTWNRKATEGSIFTCSALRYVKEVYDKEKVKTYIVGTNIRWFPKVQVMMLIGFCPLRSFLFHCLSQLWLLGRSVSLESHIDELVHHSPFWRLNIIGFKLGFYFLRRKEAIFETNFLEASFSPWCKNRFPATSLLFLRY